MFCYVHEKLQLSNSEFIFTFIVNILFSVSVCMSIYLISQDDHKTKFSKASTILFFLSMFKASLCLSIPILASCSRVSGFCSKHLFCW